MKCYDDGELQNVDLVLDTMDMELAEQPGASSNAKKSETLKPEVEKAPDTVVSGGAKKSQTMQRKVEKTPGTVNGGGSRAEKRLRCVK